MPNLDARLARLEANAPPPNLPTAEEARAAFNLFRYGAPAGSECTKAEAEAAIDVLLRGGMEHLRIDELHWLQTELERIQSVVAAAEDAKSKAASHE